MLATGIMYSQEGVPVTINFKVGRLLLSDGSVRFDTSKLAKCQADGSYDGRGVQQDEAMTRV